MLRRLLLPGALVVACLLVLALSIQHRALRDRLDRVVRRATRPHPGLYVPTVRVARLEGDTVTVGEAGPHQRQLLLVFTTTCPYCRASLPAWKQVAAAAQPTSGSPPVTVYGVSLDSADVTLAYRDAHALPFPIVRFTSKLPDLYRFWSVPTIVLLDETGRILYARHGVLTTRTGIDSVIAAIHAAPPTQQDAAAARSPRAVSLRR